MMTPKTIPLIASMFQGDFLEVKIGNGVANAVANPTILVEFTINNQTMSSSEWAKGTICGDNESLEVSYSKCGFEKGGLPRGPSFCP